MILRLPSLSDQWLPQGRQSPGEAVMNKNLARAYMDGGLSLTALDVLDETIVNFHPFGKRDKRQSIYLAECYQLQARIYYKWGMKTTAQRSWQDSLGFALSVAESLRLHLPTRTAYHNFALMQFILGKKPGKV